MLIFHSPLSIGEPEKRPSGSGVRPWNMLKAFLDLNVCVYVVDGDSRRRNEKWRLINRSGSILGVYSELSTMPTALSDPDHLPRAPFQDFRHFSNLRRAGIPVTAFYRDVYWRFPHYSKVVPLHKRLPALTFYGLEAWQIARHVNHVFLPSMRMKEHIPFIRDKAEVSALPPGGVVREVNRPNRSGPLRLFYVGGVGGQQYDIYPMLRAVEAVNGVELTLCCRQPEWIQVRDKFGELRNVKIVHHSGRQLDQHYRSADVFLMWRNMNEYLRFAMPVKLPEALGWGLPIITNSRCEMGDLVDRENLGWTPDTEQDLVALLTRLRDHRDEVLVRSQEVIKRREAHTWQARAKTVLSTLEQYRRLP